MKAISLFGSLGILGMISACASTSPKAALDETSALVDARVGQKLATDDAETDERRRQVSALLARDLTLENAIRVSLLANRELQANYEELGIAQAELVQAGLLRNPSFGATYDFPLDSSHPTFELSFVTELVQLMTLGARKRVAGSALAATKYRVASKVVEHVYEVKNAFYSVQAAQQTFAMRRIVRDASQVSVELARRQHEAGTMSDLDLANEEALYAQMTTDFRRSQGELSMTREHLTRLMGVWGKDAAWTVSDQLPELPVAESSFDHLESKAVAHRLDLAAAHKDVEVVSYALALAKNTRWTGGIDAGIDFHREAEGVRLFGPSVSVELPLFDQGRATVARVEAQLRQTKKREGALAVDVRSEVRELAARLLVARGVVEDYRGAVIPTRERVVAFSQQQYDAMLLGVYQLLVAKQNEITAYRDYIEALRDYWTLRAELERKVGTNLPIPSAPTTPGPAATPAPVPSSPTKGSSGHDHHSP